MARVWTVVAVLVAFSAVIQAAQLLGGRRAARTDSPGVQQALSFALYQYNKGSNDMYAARPVTVKKVETQLVSGIIYFIDVDIGRTQCKKPTTDVNSCDFHTDPGLSKVISCHFEVYVVPWTSKTEMRKFKCN